MFYFAIIYATLRYNDQFFIILDRGESCIQVSLCIRVSLYQENLPNKDNIAICLFTQCTMPTQGPLSTKRDHGLTFFTQF